MLRQFGMKFDGALDFLAREQQSFTNAIRTRMLDSLTYDGVRCPATYDGPA